MICGDTFKTLEESEKKNMSMLVCGHAFKALIIFGNEHISISDFRFTNSSDIRSDLC